MPEAALMLLVAPDGTVHIVRGEANGGTTCLRCLTEKESLALADAICTGTARARLGPHSEARH